MNKNIFHLLFGVALLGVCATSCKEDIDESARYTFTNETVTDYLRNTDNAQFSEFSKMIDEVAVSTHSESKVSQLLSARGNFVVFAPTNSAITRYLYTVAEKGIIDASVENIGDIQDAYIQDSLKKVIVHNAIVDFSEYQSVFQYISDIAPLPDHDPQTMTYSNLNNRYLKIQAVDPKFMITTDEGDQIEISSYSIDGAHTYKTDIQVYNGIVHEMYEVVAPSNDKMLDVLGKNPELSAFAELIGLCGLSEALSVSEDDVYHELYWSNPDKYQAPYHTTQHRYPNKLENRLIGFSAFIETNDVYKANNLLADDGSVDLDALRTYLSGKQPAGLDQGMGDDDFKKTDNWLNYFVTYHILPMAIEYDNLLVHYNELGYLWSNAESVPTITQTEHYTTMGAPRLMSISEGGNYTIGDVSVPGTNGKRINYFANYERSNTVPGKSPSDVIEGILIRNPVSVPEWSNIEQPINGQIYPITEMLFYSDEIARRQGSMRLRLDVCSLFPELMTNHIRRPKSEKGDFGFTKNYPYIENMSWSDESNVYYLPGYAGQWHNYQGDEFNITGAYDIYVKLPPIPYSSTYEVRLGVSVNPCRGMMQVYFGKDKESMPAAGIPLDMRMGGILRYQDWNGNKRSNSNVGWEADGENETLNQEVDKKMRLQGFMKAPAGFAKLPVVGSFDVANSMRNNCESYGSMGNCVRRIIVRQDMEKGDVYWIRFKDVLGNPNSQFFLDYFEIVPKEVYDNPVNPEDIW